MNTLRESQNGLMEDQRPRKIRRTAASISVPDLSWSLGNSEILEAPNDDCQHSSRGSTWTTIADEPEPSRTTPMQLSSTSTGQPSRTRGPVACQKCRSRKTKCDNQRPACGYCLKVGEPCVYETEATSHCHVFGQEVLQALSELRDIVLRPSTTLSLIDGRERTEAGQDGISPFSVRPFTATPNSQPAAASSDFGPKSPVSLGQIQKVEDIIQWRIFQPHIVARDIYPDANLPATLSHSMPTTDAKLLTDLQMRYIHSVHLLNPILNLATLNDLIISLSENGFDWSLETCLTTLVCAIGAITEPLGASQMEGEIDPYNSQPLSDPDLAIKYWNVASKRLGLVLDRNDITAVQCLCLAGIWYMHNLQPLQAWKYFSQAANTWFCTVIRNDPLSKPSDRIHSGPINVEDALCFTIWKSMCELRPELSLPPSVLEGCQVIRPFPALPEDPGLGGASEQDERSCYYYLSEIAARHLFNDLLECHVYDYDSIQPTDVKRMIRHAEIFEAQIDEWRSSLPAQFQFDIPTDLSLPELDDPMTIVLRQRYLSSLEMTYRPLLRICTDFALQDSQGYDTSIRRKVAKLASQNLQFSYLKILRISDRLHQGTWFNLRSLTGSCLRFAAVEIAQRDAKLAGAQEVEVPPDWRSAVMHGIENLQPYWNSGRSGGAGLMSLMDQALKL